MFGIGMPELLLIFVVALLVLGPKKLPEAARSLGRGMAEFRRASADLRNSLTEPIEEIRGAAAEIEREVTSVTDTSPVQGADATTGAASEQAKAPEAAPTDAATPRKDG